jgi:hypothetical protein
MLIRIGGGRAGILEYLVEGRKQGRAHSRNELDQRVVLAGDLDFAGQLIRDARCKGERYLHITLSFKEDALDVGLLQQITEEFREYAFAAFDPSEYCFYAEAHLPRLKSYPDQRSGALVERKPHIHIVIPKVNLLSGGFLNPFGMIGMNETYIDAFQEHVNNKYGLASPKQNRRIQFTDGSDMLHRVGAQPFAGSHRELKQEILEKVLELRIADVARFQSLLGTFGSVRLRNPGRSNAYFNLRLPGNAKGINLKDFAFSASFLAASQEEKLAQLAAKPDVRYTESGQARKDSYLVERALAEWRTLRAAEVKYINSGNRTKFQEFRRASPELKKSILCDMEKRFYEKYEEYGHERAAVRRGRDPIRSGRERGRARRLQRFGRDGVDGGRGFEGAGGWGNYTSPLGSCTTAQSINCLRKLSGLDVVRDTHRPQVLLPHHARDQLEHRRTGTDDSLRRHSNIQRLGVSDGRGSSSRLVQLKRDSENVQLAQVIVGPVDFHSIRKHLDARLLLNWMSQFHGLRSEKYEPSLHADIGWRIKCGRRNLNVSDFLTKEVNLAWPVANEVLLHVYDLQLGRDRARDEKTVEWIWDGFPSIRKATATAICVESTDNSTNALYPTRTGRRRGGGAIQAQVLMNGEVLYSFAERSVVRDRGSHLCLLHTDHQAILAALSIAEGKFRSALELHGSREFKERTAGIAAQYKLRVHFDDKALESIRNKSELRPPERFER